MAKADVVVTMSSDDAKLFRSYQRQIDAEKRKEQQTRRTAQQQDRAAQSKQRYNREEEQANRSQARNLAVLRAGWAGITAVIGAATQALRVNAQMNEQAAQRNRTAFAGQGSLAEIATSRGQFRRLSSMRDAMLRTGAFADEQQATAAIVAMQNAGLTGADDREAFRQAALLNLNIPTLARSTAQVRSAFGAQAGTSRQIINRAITAASITPSTSEQVLAASARTGAAARTLGLDSQQAMSGVAVLSRTAGTADRAATQLDALFRAAITRGGFEGMSLPEMVQNISGRGMTNAQTQRFLGSSEAFQAFVGLRDDSRLLQQTISGRSSLNLEGRARLIETDIRSAATLRERRNRLEEEEADRRRGMAQQLLEAESRDPRASAIERFFLDVGRRVGGVAPETTLRARQDIGGGVSPEAEAFLNNEQEVKQTNLLESINQGIQAMRGAGRASSLRAEVVEQE